MTDPTEPVWICGTELNELVAEANRRTALDGIPRHITSDKHIMKNDWVLSEDADVDPEALEDHVRRMLESQDETS